jgi:hypothetical protein
LGILRGQFVHKDIIESDSMKNERAIGWIIHYFTGGAVALTYPAIFLGFNIAMPSNNLIPGLIWGFVTALFPWLILYPGYGWGLFGARSPRNVRPLLSSAVEHSIYGLGLGIVLNMTAKFWQAT